MQNQISAAEREYIAQGVAEDVRLDGRGNDGFRSITIEDQILPHVHGSSKVCIGNVTDVICSLKVSVGEPKHEAPSCGVLDLCIDVSQYTNVRVDERQLQDFGNNLSEILKSILVDSSSLNLEEYCIIEGKYCWILHLDIVVLRFDGSIVDAASIAILNTLEKAKIPLTKKIMGESGIEEDFDISGDLENAVSVDTSNVPLCITVVKIGSSLIADPSNLEVMCASGQLVVALDKTGACCGIHKLLGGTFTVDEIGRSIMMAHNACQNIFSIMGSSNNCGDKNDSQYPEIPPVRVGLLA
jgi:exosome complex component RRP42